MTIKINLCFFIYLSVVAIFIFSSCFLLPFFACLSTLVRFDAVIFTIQLMRIYQHIQYIQYIQHNKIQYMYVVHVHKDRFNHSMSQLCTFFFYFFSHIYVICWLLFFLSFIDYTEFGLNVQTHITKFFFCMILSFFCHITLTQKTYNFFRLFGFHHMYILCHSYCFTLCLTVCFYSK